MNHITFKNIETSKTLTFDCALNTLTSSGQEIFIQDTALSTLLKVFFSLKESQIISYSDISNLIKAKKSSLHMEDNSDNIIANKYVFKARHALKSVLIDDFIVTIRGLGYRVSNKWLAVTEKQSNNDKKIFF